MVPGPYGPLLTLVVVVVVAALVVRSVRIVEEPNVLALFVGGEMRAVLHPGLHFVPPVRSATYPIDPSTMTVDRGDERVPVPERFVDDVREGDDATPDGNR